MEPWEERKARVERAKAQAARVAEVLSALDGLTATVGDRAGNADAWRVHVDAGSRPLGSLAVGASDVHVAQLRSGTLRVDRGRVIQALRELGLISDQTCGLDE